MGNHLLCHGMVLCMAIGLFTSPVRADPATPDDFGPGADIIDFNDLPPGIRLSGQLRTSGIAVRADVDAAPIIVDEAAAGTELPSLPLALQADKAEAVEFLLTPPRQAFGFSFLLPAGESLLLQAFDDQNKFIEQIVVTSDTLLSRSRAVSEADFAALAGTLPVIAKVRVVPLADAPSPIIDDLLVQPGIVDAVDIGPYLNDLAPGGKQDLKLAAIDAIMLLPSPQTSEALLDVAENDPDPYAREKALLALAQHFDIKALPNLIDIALNDTDANVGSAARNAVHVLRQQWPIPDPPLIDFKATGPFTAGVPFTAEITVISPVDRDRVLLRHEFRSHIVPVPGSQYRAVEDSLQAGVPLGWTVDFIPEDNGRDEVELVVELTLNLVDYASYRKKLFFIIDEDGGSASPDMFPDAPPAEVNELPPGKENQ